MDLAKHIVVTKSGHFEPDKFDDHYESVTTRADREEVQGNEDRGAQRAGIIQEVINLMDALRRSAQSEQAGRKTQSKSRRKRIEGQREMLLAIPGKKAAKEETKRPVRSTGKRKVG